MEANKKPEPVVYDIHAEPATATDQDIDSWQQSAITRKPTKRVTPESMWNTLSGENPVRARRLRKDYEWAQKKLQKRGLNPEDLRFIL